MSLRAGRAPPSSNPNVPPPTTEMTTVGEGDEESQAEENYEADVKVVKAPKKKKEKKPRIIKFNHRMKKYRSNYVSTTKYNIITFIPRNLLEQFLRLANVYFLIVSILQQIPGVSPTGRWTTLGPLIIVLSVTALKEALEDLRRYQQDRKINNKKVDVLQADNTWKETRWKKLRVGQVIRIKNYEQVPADIVLLSSTRENGTAYIETSSLDGETNLKLRSPVAETSELMFNSQNIIDTKAELIVEAPNKEIYEFKGSMKIYKTVTGVENANNGDDVTIPAPQPDGDEAEKLEAGDETVDHVPLDNKSVILRGCFIRNTEWLHGVIVYTGKDTKLMKNSKRAKIKRSRVERRANVNIALILILLLVVSLSATIASFTWHEYNLSKAWYLPQDWESTDYLYKGFMTFMILFNNLVPISLYVSMEIVKVVQAMLINNDREMYHEETNTPAAARTSNLNEELGQISYIFSDKTGTLTRNLLEFRKCAIDGDIYGFGTTEIGIAAAKRMGKEVQDHIPSDASKKKAQYHYDPKFNFDDERLLKNLKGGAKADKIKMFLRILSVCHEVIPETPDPSQPDKITYQAPNPDDAALVNAAKAFGFKFFGRSAKMVTVDVMGIEEQWEMLNTLQFNSTRKRMSVIVKNAQGKIILMCKGADSTIMARLDPKVKQGDDLAKEQLLVFSGEGLRTLCLAYKEIPAPKYEEWAKRYAEASVSMGDREAEMEELNDEIERDLVLAGCTAIEDKLQEGVPQTIADLAKAGIKIWVLTGDKKETAINIGFACSLLVEGMLRIEIDAETDGELREQMAARYEEFKVPLENPGTADLALIIEGAPLSFVMEDKALRLKLLKIARRCKSVICCRVSPAQKAQVTRLIKDNIGRGQFKDEARPITLSIGDGANDVPMIMEAHIGVGISGLEGMQAVRASDYAIAQFRFLKRLLLVHGSWSYKRISKVIIYSFYKNVAFVFTLFWFQFFTGFSGQVLYDRWLMVCYNVVFTNIPIIIWGIMEQDVSAEGLMKYPQLYQPAQKGEYFNVFIFWKYQIEAIFISICVFFIPFTIFGQKETWMASGQSAGLWSMGTVVYACIVLAINGKLILETTYWNWVTHIVQWCTVLSWPVVFAAYGGFWIDFTATYTTNVYFVPYEVWSSINFWFTVPLVTCICLLPDFTYKYFKKNYFPGLIDVMQRLERSRKYKKALKAEKMRLKAEREEQLRQEEEENAAYEAEHAGETQLD